MECLSDYQVYVIRNPYYSLRGNTHAQSVYGQIQSLKAEWYASAHEDKVLPFGVDEMISTHVLIKSKGIPVATFKINNYKDCKDFKLEHPVLANIKDNQKLYLLVKEEIRRILGQGRTVGYIGNLSRNPSSQFSLKINPILGRLIGFIFYKCSNLLNIDEYIITGGITNKAYKYIEGFGFTKFTSEIVEVEALNYLPAYILHHENVSLVKPGNFLDSAWNNRIEYTWKESIEEKHAA